MESKLYQGSHRHLFEVFLGLVDDSEAQTGALLELISWENAESLLSVGGGEGKVEVALLRHMPRAKIWYFDPSPEQCKAFRQNMSNETLLDRVSDIAETTFQEYSAVRRFDRIISMFSWFYIGTEDRWLDKLRGLLNTTGIAAIILPNSTSIEADFNQSLSPDKRTTLVSEDLVSALQGHDCRVSTHSFTKWLSTDELIQDGQITDTALAFAAFVALRPIKTFTTTDKQLIGDLLATRRSEHGIPMTWDVIIIENA